VCHGANPTSESYNASAVKIYNATSSLVRFGKKFIFYPEKNAGVVVVNSEDVGLALGVVGLVTLSGVYGSRV
jgi:hypothetical protein